MNRRIVIPAKRAPAAPPGGGAAPRERRVLGLRYGGAGGSPDEGGAEAQTP